VGVVVLVHGRGGSAYEMLELSREFFLPGLAVLVPQAAGDSWYPCSFLVPLEQNEPGLSSGLAVLRGLLDDAADAGIKTDRVVLFGFSQGACLSLEFAARHAQRFGGIVGLSGGLIGPSGTPRAYGGSLAGTPVFLGCSDVDPHIPRARVLETADVLGELGADVTERIYPGMGHTVNRDELDAVRVMLHGIAGMART
jgi:predicted esterase